MKRLNFVKFLGLLALLFVVGVGCDDEKEDTPLTSVYQTQWRGTYRGDNNFEREYDMIAFSSDTQGFCIHKDGEENSYSDFRYKQDNKIINIYDLYSFGGTWWIMKLTQSEMILQGYRNNDGSTETLTLTRLY
ncbi:MAG: hypothetical protein RR996_02010 [Alistipes sp.]